MTLNDIIIFRFNEIHDSDSDSAEQSDSTENSFITAQGVSNNIVRSVDESIAIQIHESTGSCSTDSTANQ